MDVTSYLHRKLEALARHRTQYPIIPSMLPQRLLEQMLGTDVLPPYRRWQRTPGGGSGPLGPAGPAPAGQAACLTIVSVGNSPAAAPVTGPMARLAGEHRQLAASVVMTMLPDRPAAH